MRLRAALKLVRSGDLPARLRAVRDGHAAIRVALLGAAIDTGVLDALRHSDASVEELAARVQADDHHLLVAFRHVLQASGHVRKKNGRWRLSHKGRVVQEDGVVRAAYEAFSGYHTALYRDLPSQLEGGPARRDIVERGDLIARLSTAFEPFVTDTLTALVTARRPARVLDVGCGAGLQLATMLDAAPHAHGVGIETDPGAAALAHTTLSTRGLAHRATVLTADVRDVVHDPALAGGPVDLALLANVIYYLPVHERVSVLSAVAGLLRPGGGLVVVSTVAAPALFSRHFDLLLRAQDGAMQLPETEVLLEQLRDAGLMPSPPRRIAPGEPLVAVLATKTSATNDSATNGSATKASETSPAG